MNPEAEGLGDLLGPIVARALWDESFVPPLVACAVATGGSGAMVRYQAGTRPWEVRESLLCSHATEEGWSEPVYVLLREEGSFKYLLAVSVNGEFALLSSSLRRRP